MKDKDLEKIEKLIELMDKKGLTEIEIKKPFLKIHLKREEIKKYEKPRVKIQETEAVKEVMEEKEIKEKEEIKERENKFYFITAPLVGTFYRAPAPDSEPYVEVGSHIKPGQVVCIIEAMKIMNEIESEVGGTVREILVKNGEPVEYGQKLFKIELT